MIHRDQEYNNGKICFPNGQKFVKNHAIVLKSVRASVRPPVRMRSTRTTNCPSIWRSHMALPYGIAP